MASYSTPPRDPYAEPEFNPESIRRRATAGDYAIYAVILLIVIGVIGCVVFYFTRPDVERERIRTRISKWLGRGSEEPLPKVTLKAPKLDGLLPEGPEVALPEGAGSDQPGARPGTESTKPVAVSTYAGGVENQVLVPELPSLPKAGEAFVRFAGEIKVSGIFAGPPAKAMLNGRWVKVGEVVSPELGVRFAGVDTAKKRLILRDSAGAEVWLTY